MGLEDDIAAGDERVARQRQELALFAEQFAEFSSLMERRGVEPDVMYRVEFIRQDRKGRVSRSYGPFTTKPVSGIDVYRVTPIARAWFCQVDNRDWAGPDTGTAITVDGLGLRWTTDHDSARRSSGGKGGGGGKSRIEYAYEGLQVRHGPSFLDTPLLPTVVVPAGEPFPFTATPQGARAKNPFIEIAEFYLGATTTPPAVHF